jgi:hypothetical protein
MNHSVHQTTHRTLSHSTCRHLHTDTMQYGWYVVESRQALHVQHTACALTQSTCAHSHKGDFAYDPSLVHGANGSTAVHNAAVEAGRRVAAARPDLIVLTTPHGKHSASLPCRSHALHHVTTCPHAQHRFRVVVTLCIT